MNPPRPWIAAVLSLLAPGLGQLYSGHVARAIGIVLLLQVLTFLLALLFITAPFPVAVLVVAPIVAVGVFILIAIDAARVARRGRTRFHRRFALIGSLLAFVVVVAAVEEPLRALRNQVLGQAYRMPSGAMLPALLVGDHFTSNRLAYLSREPQRGDVVVFEVAQEGPATYPADRRPELPREIFVKRVVGVPGDRVEFEGASLIINDVRRTGAADGGEYVDAEGNHLRVALENLDGREYQILDAPETGPSGFEPTVVEPGRYFIAGDNRDHSKDSRYFGTVSREHILAPVSRIYWSWDFNGPSSELLDPMRLLSLVRERARWSRVGMPIN